MKKIEITDRTDLVSEITTDNLRKNQLENELVIENVEINKISVTRTKINEKAAKILEKPKGNYITMFCENGDKDKETETLLTLLKKLIGDIIGEKLAKNNATIMVTGLGNENITPDSLGVLTTKKVLATAHFIENGIDDLGLNKVYVIEPGVMAKSGMESASQIKYIAAGIKPDVIIAIDSLACNDEKRLAKTIQITDTGISPGSGVKNHREELSRETIGIPVIAIGVPLCIELSLEGKVFMATPKDIDALVLHYSKVISGAINRTLNEGLSEEEIEGLVV